jgi:hypothetical protein
VQPPSNYDFFELMGMYGYLAPSPRSGVDDQSLLTDSVGLARRAQA